MRPLALLVCALVLLPSHLAFAAKDTPTMDSLYKFDVSGNDGLPVSLGKYKGQVALVVNTASKCGFTPQYKELEAVYKKYREQGLVVLGFPSNDFGAQEPGSNADIKKFCELNYKIGFPLFAKAGVKGEGKQPVYRYLTEASDPRFQGEVEWNFEKFLVGKDGKVIGRYKSKVKPTDPDLVAAIEAQLK